MRKGILDGYVSKFPVDMDCSDVIERCSQGDFGFVEKELIEFGEDLS